MPTGPIRSPTPEYVECVADDVKPVKWTSLPQAVKPNEGEVVLFSWIVYQSRKRRNTVNAKMIVIADHKLA